MWLYLFPKSNVMKTLFVCHCSLQHVFAAGLFSVLLYVVVFCFIILSLIKPFKNVYFNASSSINLDVFLKIHYFWIYIQFIYKILQIINQFNDFTRWVQVIAKYSYDCIALISFKMKVFHLFNLKWKGSFKGNYKIKSFNIYYKHYFISTWKQK